MVIFGENEFQNKQVQLKNMIDGSQEAVDISELSSKIMG